MSNSPNLQDQLNQQLMQAQVVEARLQTANVQLEAAQSRLKQLNPKLEEETQVLLKKRQDELDSIKNDHDQQLEDDETERSRIVYAQKAEIEYLDTKIGEHKSILEALEFSIAQSKQDKVDILLELEDIKDQVSAQNEALDSLKQQKKVLREEVDAFRDQAKAMQQNTDSHTDTMKRLMVKERELTQVVSDLTKKEAELSGNIDKLKQQQTSIFVDIDNAQVGLQKERENIAKRSQQQDKRDELLRAREQKNDLAEAAIQRNAKLSQL